MLFDVDVNGCDHGWEVIVLEKVSHFGGPSLRQVDDLIWKFSGLDRKCVGDCEIEQKLKASLPVSQLQSRRWRLGQSVLCVHHSLEVEGVGECARTDALVLNEHSVPVRAGSRRPGGL